jgi:hypothetical protein
MQSITIVAVPRRGQTSMSLRTMNWNFPRNPVSMAPSFTMALRRVRVAGRMRAGGNGVVDLRPGLVVEDCRVAGRP